MAHPVLFSTFLWCSVLFDTFLELWRQAPESNMAALIVMDELLVGASASNEPDAVDALARDLLDEIWTRWFLPEATEAMTG